jgi:Tfp pilus assembly protein PilF
MKSPVFPLLLAALAVTIDAAAQSPSTATTTAPTPAEFQARIERRQPALQALRQGDTARADRLLRDAVRGTPATAAWHLDYADLLMGAAIDLKDRDQLKASVQYFQRTTVELEKALQASDAPTGSAAKADILYQLGFIARVGEGDQEKANGYFKRALAADPAHPAARDGLQRTAKGRKELEQIERQSPPKETKTGG